jgi:hypothetical protein
MEFHKGGGKLSANPRKLKRQSVRVSRAGLIFGKSTGEGCDFPGFLLRAALDGL